MIMQQILDSESDNQINLSFLRKFMILVGERFTDFAAAIYKETLLDSESDKPGLCCTNV